MNKAFLIWQLATILLVTGPSAQAQQAGKIPRLAILTSGGPERDAARYAGVRKALRERGYIEGQNIAVETPWWDGIGSDRRAGLAAELPRRKIDIIVIAGGDTLIRDVIDATKTIPIVMWGQGSDPVAAGFVQSLANPGGNLTGITNLALSLGGKRLEVYSKRPSLFSAELRFSTIPRLPVPRATPKKSCPPPRVRSS